MMDPAQLPELRRVAAAALRPAPPDVRRLAAAILGRHRSPKHGTLNARIYRTILHPPRNHGNTARRARRLPLTRETLAPLLQWARAHLPPS